MNKIIKENLIKNIIVLIIVISLYFPIQNFLLNSSLVENKDHAGDILVAVSIIAVIACFGNFSFQYDQLNVKNAFERCFIHIHTGFMMLIIGVAIVLTQLLITIIMGHFILMDMTLVLLYIVCVGFDILDVLRLKST